MKIKKLSIFNFRNIVTVDLDISSTITYVYGANGSGKTNLLESIRCLSLGKSPRAKRECDLINYSNKTFPAMLGCRYESDDEVLNENEFILKCSEGSSKTKKSKELKINQDKIGITKYVGNLTSIWFSPESIKILNSSPSRRRSYIDTVISQFLPEYLNFLRRYNRSLRSRNRILSGQEGIDKSTLDAWTWQVIQSSARVSLMRLKFFTQLNLILDESCHSTRYKYKVKYISKGTPIEVKECVKDSLPINSNTISDVENYLLEQHLLVKNLEVEKGKTLFGSHYDDWILDIKSSDEDYFHDSSAFASRGEQRMSLIYLQFAFVDLFRMYNNQGTVLLLDDIYSELDEENKQILTKFILKNKIQSFITGVEEKKFGKDYNTMKINEILKKDAS